MIDEDRTSAAGNSPIISVADLHKSFGPNHVLRGASLSVDYGETVILMGPSGSGKSTFLRCLNRLTDPDSGRIVVAGFVMTDPSTDLPRARREIGFVSQHFNLYPHMTVVRNVMEGPRAVLRIDADEARASATDLLKGMGLADKLDAFPAQLSGGQQQRVAIARALAMRPSVMLFDEPTSALDPELTTEVLDAMKRLADSGMTMLIVSHEMHFARRVADRVVMFDGGVIVEEGPTEQIFTDAQHQRTRRFLEQIMSWEKD